MDTAARAPGPDEDPVAAAAEVAGLLFGPACAALLREPAEVALLKHDLRGDVEVQDAVVRRVFENLKRHAAVANEFFAYLLRVLRRSGSFSMRPRMRCEGDTSDLVTSVLGDVWEQQDLIACDSLGALMKYLKTRVGWKASDRDRRLTAAKRGHDRRVSESPEDLQTAHEDPSPSDLVDLNLKADLVEELLPILTEDQRLAVQMWCETCPYEEIAEAIGAPSAEAARKVVGRALLKLREAAARRGLE